MNIFENHQGLILNSIESFNELFNSYFPNFLQVLAVIRASSKSCIVTKAFISKRCMVNKVASLKGYSSCEDFWTSTLYLVANITLVLLKMAHLEVSNTSSTEQQRYPRCRLFREGSTMTTYFRKCFNPLRLQQLFLEHLLHTWNLNDE